MIGRRGWPLGVRVRLTLGAILLAAVPLMTVIHPAEKPYRLDVRVLTPAEAEVLVEAERFPLDPAAPAD